MAEVSSKLNYSYIIIHYLTLKKNFLGKYFLVYFPEEDTVSVAEESQLVEDAHSINVGDNLHVKYGREIPSNSES